MSASNPCSRQQYLEERPVWQVILAALGIAAVWTYTTWAVIHALQLAAGLLVLNALSRYWRGTARFASSLLISPEAPEEVSRTSRWLWPAAGLAGLVVAFICLQLRQPFYFTQDDNLAQFLPGILQGCRSLAAGVFPTWNPYQYLGSPSTTVGTYALTYPPTHLSYWLARALGNEYLTIEIFTTLHLLVGYGVIYWATRREGSRPSLAVLAALCCVLSGYALLVGRGWFYMSPVFVWAPLMLVCMQHLRRRTPGWRWIAGFGLVIGAFAHAGNVQMWAYSLLLFGFGALALLWSEAIAWRTLPAMGAGFTLGVAIAAPLLVPEFLAVRDASRGLINAGIDKGLPTLFVPVTLIRTFHPMGWGSVHKELLGQMYYSGTLFCMVGTVLLLCFLFLRWGREGVQQNAWFLCALLAFILALGRTGLLWTLLAHVPGFDKFRSPFKFLQFFDIFIAVAGASALERWLRHTRAARKWEFALAVAVSALLAYNCFLALPSFYTYGFRPYPAVDPNVARRLQPQGNLYYPKFAPIAPWRSVDPDYADSLMHQWPSLYGFFSVDGYDPLVSEDPSYLRIRGRLDGDPQDSFREYGVKYVLTYKSALPARWKLEAARVYQSGNVALWELPEPRPMAFPEANPAHALPVRFDGGGADLDTSSLAQGGPVVVTMLWRSEITAWAQGRQIPTEVDFWSRIRMVVPAGTAHIRISFAPAWRLGFLAALVLLGISGLLARIHQRYNHSHGEDGDPGIHPRHQIVRHDAPAAGEFLKPAGRP